MSYDFELYARRAQSLPSLATQDGSNVVLDGPYTLEPEDIPEDIQRIVGAKRQLYRIHLEGKLTPKDQTAVEGWLGGLVLATQGVLIDLQTNHFETPTKSGHVVQVPDRLREQWWMTFSFENGEGFYEVGFETMLRRITTVMPEALPQRWGYYEPLQHKVENGDVSALIAGFKNETDVLQKAQTPFGHISMWIPCKKTSDRFRPTHFLKRRFALGNVAFEVKPKVFSSPAVMAKLLALFEDLCVELDVVYGAILKEGAIDAEWLWWRGVPQVRQHTVCIGAAYRAVWPEFVDVGKPIGRHHCVVTTDRFGNSPPPPPSRLMSPDIGHNPGGAPHYAAIFPFDFKYDYKTYVW